MTPRLPPRIVSLAPSVTNILHALGAAECLVGVTRWCPQVAPVDGLPKLGDCWSVDADAVARLSPCLVIGSVPYRSQVVEGLVARGLRFLATYPRRMDDIYGDIRLLARIVGKEREGERLVGSMKDHLKGLERKASAVTKRPRVYCEVWPNPLRTSERWVEEMVAAAGGEFVPRLPGRQVNGEEVIAADPEIIVLAWAATEDRARPEVVSRRAGWENVRAVRNGTIHVVRDELLNTPGPILMDGLNALAAIIHPEIFKGACASRKR